MPCGASEDHGQEDMTEFQNHGLVLFKKSSILLGIGKGQCRYDLPPILEEDRVPI